MNKSISTMQAGEIIRRMADGQSPENISASIGIPANQIVDLIGRIQPALIPKPRRKDTGHRLTAEDRRKGGAASQSQRSMQRSEQLARIKNLLPAKKCMEIASIAYVLQSGSSKEFLITLTSESIGLVFLRSLRIIGVPLESIRFQWRQCPANVIEENQIRSNWGAIGKLIEFPEAGLSKSLRLRVAGFNASDHDGSFTVSGRGLAQVFLLVGKEAIDAAKE